MLLRRGHHGRGKIERKTTDPPGMVNAAIGIVSVSIAYSHHSLHGVWARTSGLFRVRYSSRSIVNIDF